MNSQGNDALFLFGKVLALILQGLCALAGTISLLMIPIIILISQNMLPAIVDPEDFPLAAQYLLPGIGLLALIATSLAALFLFFGKMRAIIRSVGEGDPFNPENARRLNAMAWLLLVHEVAPCWSERSAFTSPTSQTGKAQTRSITALTIWTGC